MTKEQELKQLAQEGIILLKRLIAVLEEKEIKTVERTTSKINRPSIKVGIVEQDSLKNLMIKMGEK